LSKFTGLAGQEFLAGIALSSSLSQKKINFITSAVIAFATRMVSMAISWYECQVQIMQKRMALLCW
jgi:hypothetical protein